MTRGIYTAATAMLADEDAQQVIAQNIANASTVGYKQDIPSFKSYYDTLIANVSDGGTIGTLGNGAALDKISTDLSDGPIRPTGNTLDVALRGSAFLGVQTPSGIDYSRDGALTLTSQGQLVQVGTGLPVLDSTSRPISVPQGNVLNISNSGVITVNGKSVDTIGLFSVTNADNPTKIGDNLLTLASPAKTIDPASSPTSLIESGYLEDSNVSVIKQMVTMLACQRTYEADQKALKSSDDMQGQVASDVSKVQ